MWYLTSEHDNRVMYIVSSTNVIIIGRSVDNQVCNYAFPDDASISRKHATLVITNNSLFLQDLGSRYGTFLNNEKVEVNKNIMISENDVIKFGKLNSIWKVNKANLTTCTSTLKGENLQSLKLILTKIGGVLKGDWDDTCTRLTMPAITLTIKVVLALVQGSNIVTTEYWSKCLENVTKLVALPDPNDYIPQVVESTLNKEAVSFLPEPRRKTLFEGKKFVFFSRRQFEMYKTVLIKSGALPMLLSECRMTISMLCGQDVVVIQYTASGISQETQGQKTQISDIVNQLKNKGRRVVADAEIGLAILYCSMNKYCNPNFSFTSVVVKQMSEPVKSSKVLAHESQEPASEQRKENVKINESLMSQDSNEKLTTKRKLSEFTSEVEVNANKKFATICYNADVKHESAKRKLSDDDQGSMPSKKVATINEENSNETSLNPADHIENENSDDKIFNFVKPASTNSGIEGKVKKLNLSRPQKRKLNDNNEDESLFNFVQSNDELKTDSNMSKQSLFNIAKKKKVGCDESEATNTTKRIGIAVEDVSAMKGSKLKELMENDTNNVDSMKREKTEELEMQMNKLDLCNTIVTMCNNLVLKKEPCKVQIENSFVNITSVKNIKAFKKVWPVKRQASIIHTSSMILNDTTEARCASLSIA